jgi:hypothetical protein
MEMPTWFDQGYDFCFTGIYRKYAELAYLRCHGRKAPSTASWRRSDVQRIGAYNATYSV